MASPVVSKEGERIGDLLLNEGLITRVQRDKALQEQRQNGTRVGYNLVKLGYVQEIELTKTLARQYKMPAVDLSKFEVDPKIVKLIPADIAVKNLVLPLKRDGRTLTVAMADPTNFAVIDDLKFITRYDIFPVIAGEFTLRNTLDKIYESNEVLISALLEDIDRKSTRLNSSHAEIYTLSLHDALPISLRHLPGHRGRVHAPQHARQDLRVERGPDLRPARGHRRAGRARGSRGRRDVGGGSERGHAGRADGGGAGRQAHQRTPHGRGEARRERHPFRVLRARPPRALPHRRRT